MSTLLPVRLAPRPGQALDSYLEQLADANQLNTTALIRLLRNRSQASTRHLTLAPEPSLLRTIADLADLQPEQLSGSVLTDLPSVPALTSRGRYAHRPIAARGWIQLHGTQACPGCLAQTGTWATTWRLLTVTTCAAHACHLVITCPGCDRPLRDGRHHHLRPVGATTLCGNPIGATRGPGPRCQHDLALIPTGSAESEHLTRQTRTDTALRGAPVTVIGRDSPAHTYLSDLQHLAVLLLNLASVEGSDDLAPWVGPIRAEATARTRTRGPRWGLRPPHDPELRAQVLTSADTILAAPDREHAAHALSAWVALTPRGADGRIGWLADHTVMTDTMSTLITAALAPYRRISHQLTHPRRPLSTLNPRAIPQVLPVPTFREHLAGVLNVEEHIARSYACLCLARVATGTTTWAQAAEAIGLPDELGRRTARTCSASLATSSADFINRLHRVAAGLTHTLDYRELEATGRAHQRTRAWFTTWTREHRPTSISADRPQALTWWWLHVAHAHRETSPSAPATAQTAQGRAAYHRFEHSLTAEQQEGLTRALRP